LQLVELDDPDTKLWTECEKKLHQVDLRLDFEFSGKDDLGVREFVITANANRELFALVDQLIEQAPELAAWRVRGLKPALGEDFEFSIEGLTLSPRALWFAPMENSRDPDAFGIKVGIAGLQDESEAVTAAVGFVVMTMIGEREFGSQIHYIETSALPSDPQAEGYFHLPALSTYIDLRAKGMLPSQKKF
jgi:hypothetical protein